MVRKVQIITQDLRASNLKLFSLASESDFQITYLKMSQIVGRDSFPTNEQGMPIGKFGRRVRNPAYQDLSYLLIQW